MLKAKVAQFWYCHKCEQWWKIIGEKHTKFDAEPFRSEDFVDGVAPWD